MALCLSNPGIGRVVRFVPILAGPAWLDWRGTLVFTAHVAVIGKAAGAPDASKEAGCVLAKQRGEELASS